MWEARGREQLHFDRRTTSISSSHPFQGCQSFKKSGAVQCTQCLHYVWVRYSSIDPPSHTVHWLVDLLSNSFFSSWSSTEKSDKFCLILFDWFYGPVQNHFWIESKLKHPSPLNQNVKFWSLKVGCIDSNLYFDLIINIILRIKVKAVTSWSWSRQIVFWNII